MSLSSAAAAAQLDSYIDLSTYTMYYVVYEYSLQFDLWDCALCAAYPKQSSGRPHSSRGWIQLSPAVVRSTRFFHWDNYNELKTSLLFITVSVQKMPAIVCHLYCILLAFFWKIITNMHRTYIKSCWRCEPLTFDSAATQC